MILGISHDAGYAPFLDELFQDVSTQIRVTVLEGIATVRELAATGVNILNLNDRLFRSEKLVGRALPSEPCVSAVAFEVKAITESTISAGTLTPATSAASTPAQAPAATYARAAVKNPTTPPQTTTTTTTQTQPKQTPAAASRSPQSPSKPSKQATW